MTTKNFSMMVIGMMILGTVNSFGSVKNIHFQSTKTEKVVKNNQKQENNCDCKTCKDLVKKQQKSKVIREAHQASSQKKNQCTCKNCQTQQQQKTDPTCKMQPNMKKK